MKKRDLDFYVNTPDENFNQNAQRFYFRFTGNNKPETDKPFEDFIDATYEAYFFAINNPSKPFGCIAKVKELANLKGFNDADLLLFVDLLLGLISNMPDIYQFTIVIIQLIDFRHDLSPYDKNQEIFQEMSRVFYFDIDKIKKTLKNTTDPSDKIVYLSNLKFDFNSRKFKMKDGELDYYKAIGLLHFINVEIDRAKFEENIRNNNKSINTDKQVIDFKLATKKKADFIRMISELYDNDMFEPVNPAVLLTKEYILDEFGKFLNEDLSTVIEVEKPFKQTKKKKSSEKNNDEGKAFPYYLLHEDNIKLADAIKKEFSTEKGKFIRILLEAMEAYDPPLISIGSRQGNEIYDSLKLFMNRGIGTYQSVFGYTFDEETDKTDLEKVTIRLKHLLKMIEKDKIA